MVIESDDRVRPLIVQTLRNSGFHVESFIDAQAGLEAFQRAPQSWSIVLAELDGGRLDGATCIRRMRDTTPGLPVLLLTAEPADVGEHLVDAQTRVLVKPFTVAALRSTLADLLNSPSLR
jgi:DNA-binding response OmpR family regulator